MSHKCIHFIPGSLLYYFQWKKLIQQGQMSRYKKTFYPHEKYKVTKHIYSPCLNENQVLDMTSNNIEDLDMQIFRKDTRSPNSQNAKIGLRCQVEILPQTSQLHFTLSNNIMFNYIYINTTQPNPTQPSFNLNTKRNKITDLIKDEYGNKNSVIYINVNKQIPKDPEG